MGQGALGRGLVNFGRKQCSLFTALLSNDNLGQLLGSGTDMWFRIVLVLLLSLGTILFSTTCHQYEVVGENLLQNPLFQDNLLNWRMQSKDSVSAQDGILTLSNPVRDTSRSISARQTVTVPYGQRLLYLSCEARALDVAPGPKLWETARVLILPLISEGKTRHDVPHTLALLDGTTPWTRYEQIFRVPEENTAVSIVVQLLNASGTLEVRSFSLRSAIEKPSYSKWQHALMLAWFIAGPWIVWPLLRAAHRNAGRAGLLVIGSMILVGILMPASMKHDLTPSWLLPKNEALAPFRADLLQTAIPFRFELFPAELNIYKLAHLLLFALIGYLFISKRPYDVPIRAIIGIVALFALATESMQILASGRDGSLGDVLIDLIGTCCGLLAATSLQRHYSQKPKVGP